MVEDQKLCPIWGTPASISHEDYGRLLHVRSERAGGRYTISNSAAAVASQLKPIEKARLTTWIIDQQAAGIERPILCSLALPEIIQRRPLSVIDRGERLLKHLQTRLPLIGDTIRIPSVGQDLLLLAWSESIKMSEVTYLLDFLLGAGFLDKSNDVSLPLGFHGEYTMAPGGYAHLAERATNTTQAFVAMWFDPSIADAYESGLRLGIEDAGFRPIRIDQKDHNNKIDDEIIAEIRRSRFLVADFTQGESGARGGVYYEAGFAHGLGIPVIFTCRRDVIDKVHFDTRQYNHIAWENSKDLRDRLAKRISATIGDGPEKK